MIVLTLVVGFQSSNVDNFAHIGGFVGGAVVMLLLSPFLSDEEKDKGIKDKKKEKNKDKTKA